MTSISGASSGGMSTPGSMSGPSASSGAAGLAANAGAPSSSAASSSPSPSSAASSSVSVLGVPVHLGALSLVTLTLQNSALTIVLHYSRISVPADKTYSAATAVLLNELLKGSISLTIATYNALVAMYYSPPLPAPSSMPGAASSSMHSARRSVSAPATGLSAGLGSLASSSSGLYQPLSTVDDFGKDEEKGGSPGHFHGRRQPSWNELLNPVRIKRALMRIKTEVFSSDCWKLSIPACLYVIQNNLQFVAASNLDVPTFQVTYNLKILTTALFSVILLRRRLSSRKWAALFCLAAGVAIVQLQSTKATGGGHKEMTHEMDRFKGLAAVAMACMTSGLAGVYFEMVLKGSKADLWVRNIQLSFFSLLPALVPVFFPGLTLFSGGASKAPVERQPIFAHFGFWAWAVVSVQVFGGLVTALVIKYSDNIMKGFATSLAIVLSFCAGIILFEFQVTLSFLVGTAVVVGATYLYNQPDNRPSGGAAYTPLQSVSPQGSPRVHIPTVGSGASSRVYPNHAHAGSISLNQHSDQPSLRSGSYSNSPPTYRRAANGSIGGYMGATTPDLLVNTGPLFAGVGMSTSSSSGSISGTAAASSAAMAAGGSSSGGGPMGLGLGTGADKGLDVMASGRSRSLSGSSGGGGGGGGGGGPGGLHVDTTMAGWTSLHQQRQALSRRDVSPGESNPLTP